MGALLERYRPAIEGYILQKFRCSAEDAADLFQGFVLNCVLRKELIARARPLEGRQFRSFLLCALHNFVLSEHRRATAQKRRPENGIICLDELDGLSHDRAAAPADSAFDLAWAQCVLEDSLDRMKVECATRGRDELWTVFDKRVLGPTLDGSEPVSYDALIEMLQIESPAQAHNLLVTAKRMFGRCLTNAVAAYVVGEEDVETELRQLRRILSESAEYRDASR